MTSMANGCLLLTRDEDVSRAWVAYGVPVGGVTCVDDERALRDALAARLDAIVLVDLSHRAGLDVLAELCREAPHLPVIALGIERSDPAMAAEAMGAFALEIRDPGRARAQWLLKRAAGHLELAAEVRGLREMLDAAPAAVERRSESRAGGEAALPVATLHFTEALRHFGDADAFFASVAEGVARCARVSRAGIFSMDRRNEIYRLRAGVKCLPGTRELTFSHADPAVRWMSRHAHVIGRSQLGHVRGADERTMLTRLLDLLGAEAIVPLYGRDRIIGWVFFGHHATGIPFEQADVENLVSLAENVALMLDNALLYDEVAVQKTLAETVLQAIPVGIVAADAESRVRWFNDAAAEMLGQRKETVLNEPLSGLGSRLAHVLTGALRGDAGEKPMEWNDRGGGRTLSAVARPLTSGAQCLGAVAMVHDLTRERLFREKQEQLERTAFWTELAAAMSHEVRNPLVAISTFAQLLPERYADEEFRKSFSVLVAQEINRLNAMIDQINSFANPPELTFEALRADVVLTKAVAVAVSRLPASGVNVERVLQPNLPRLWGDEQALVDCFAHLVVNALEAVEHKTAPSVRIEVTAESDKSGRKAHLTITVADNGRGMTPDLQEKAYSPFSTTKARGIGLGLPIVRRTLMDHGGEVTIESSGGGTNVRVRLPSAVTQEATRETCVGSR
jgi:nitrogen-specific signal transduction histidine kinase